MISAGVGTLLLCVHLVHLGLWISCNASEAPTWPVTLNLLPGRGDDASDIDDTLHLSLATPQLNHPDQEEVDASDLNTDLCLGWPSILFNAAKNIPQGLKNHQASLVPVLPDAMTGDESDGEPFNQRYTADPHESHQIVPSQNPPSRHTCTFSLLPTRVENVNFQTSPLQTQKERTLSYPTCSGIANNLPSNLEVNPNHQFPSNLEIVARSSSKLPNQTAYNCQGLPASGAHSQCQSAKKFKLKHPPDSLNPIESSPSEIESNLPLTGAEEKNLEMINQPKGGEFTGNSGSSSHMNLKSQKVLYKSATNVVPRAEPHLRPERVTPSIVQHQLAKPTKIFNFNQDIFNPGKNMPKEYVFKLEKICSLIELFQEARLVFFKSKFQAYVYQKSSMLKCVGLPMNKERRYRERKNQRQKLQSDSMKEFESNETQWFGLWAERTGEDFEDIKKVSTTQKRDFGLLLLYIDIIGTLLQNYYPNNPNDPSLSLLKKTIELAKQSVLDKSYSFHKFPASSTGKTRGHCKKGFRPLTVNWNWISTVVGAPGYEKLQLVLFQDGEKIPHETRAFFSDIFLYSILNLNQRLKDYYRDKKSTWLLSWK
jgi:hypothetical protein